MAAAAARRGAHSTGAAMHNHPKQGCSCELMGNQSQNNWASCCSIKVRTAWIPSSTSWLCSLDSCSPSFCPCPSLCYWQYKQPQSWLLSVRARGKSCSFCTDQMQYYHKEKENAASSFCSEHPVTSSDWPSCCLLLAVCICLEMCLGKVFFFFFFFCSALKMANAGSLSWSQREAASSSSMCVLFIKECGPPYLLALWTTWNTQSMDNTCQHISLDTSREKNSSNNRLSLSPVHWERVIKKWRWKTVEALGHFISFPWGKCRSLSYSKYISSCCFKCI